MFKKIILILVLISAPIFGIGLKPDSTVVTVKGRQILLNGSRYIIKGVCYNPVPKGSHQRNFKNIDQDLKLMVAAGINTIRVYQPIDDKHILDKIYKAGLKIIIGFGYNQNGHFDILSGSYKNYIKTFKNHPAILFWEFGNEYNYHPEWFNGSLKNWYTALNKAAAVSHQLDPNHPVSTAHGELPNSSVLAACPNIDIWGLNIYRWDKPGSVFKDWRAISSKPMFLSEAGTDSYMTVSKLGYHKGSNEKAQADATANILNAVFKASEVCSGVTLFEFVDELWKAGNESVLDPGGWAPNSSGVPYDGTANEEYWGIVKINRQPKMVYNVVKKIYKSNN